MQPFYGLANINNLSLSLSSQFSYIHANKKTPPPLLPCPFFFLPPPSSSKPSYPSGFYGRWDLTLIAQGKKGEIP
ncbi:hypothetical protein RIF29_41369 [Crotalaria pallida]|uniref:Uncharacterized protein n=1 Tax=Crotalaria pallida TaxID=3830 RepID=A0AAN9E5G0_CROPI